ncbi:endo-beta-N-acetylglucosaminidase [Streptomyces sp. H27-D2]|uniref:endo-beta-N-acetylglucosaminidase n=1 Tax=Streptomyces sp. H27-D2 TaxID=3046304 RepID=UPI002DB9A094|nr:endo-beta-N-acetylglucosaminidase [Streptomyces sp. H27-D2]MEC4015406.1 endo-beta-N-acetylglucosaminidase [Streptomyces sp. H27-D2]
MTQQSSSLSRRGLVLTGAGGAAALLGSALTGTATAAPRAPGTRAARAVAAGAALQPYASYWFPDSLPSGDPGEGITWRSLKEWTAVGDQDLAFNTATVPLADRFTPVPANGTARAHQARIAPLVSFDHTAGNPSQGSATADYYALTHWAYIDELVFWGGSAKEGIVLAPNAPVVDAAHRNGVPVLGTVFLPPVHYGGDPRWTRDLVQRDALGRFTLARKLAEIAAAYGFDGWFINAETEGGDAALAADMHGFLRALRAQGASRGMRTIWYDAMDSSGDVAWQGALNSRNQRFFQDEDGKVADSMFVDFRWNRQTLAASGRLAETLDRGRYELWAGVDVESNGWNARPDWDAIIPGDGDHVVSYGFYRPEWTLNHLPRDRTPGQFHAADDRFWSGEGLDPTQPDPKAAWRAPAVAVADRSTVFALPFATTFNTGHGLRWYEEGAVTSKSPWNHLGLQDRLPGRRWAVRTTGRRPDVSLDFEAAWRGGSSLLVAGELDAPATVELYATRLPLGRNTVVDITHRAEEGPVRVELAVALHEPDEPGAPLRYTCLPAGTVRPGWTTATVRLGSLGGGTAHALGVRLTGQGGRPVKWRLGALAVREGPERPAAPAHLRITDAEQAGGKVALRFSWRRSPGDVRHYELHRTLPDGTRRFLGGTCGTAFYVPALERERGERAALFELRAVGELYSASGPARTSRIW